MRRSSRLLVGALLGTVGLLGATVTPASAFGQTSVDSAVVDSSTRVQVEGTLVVFAGGDGIDTAVVATPLADEVRLVTPAGDSVVLTGALAEDVTTGSTFAGTVSIPTEAVSEINAVVEEALGEEAPSQPVNRVDAESAVGSEILAASETLDAPLAVVKATITAEAVAVGQTATAHTLDVAVVTLPTAPAEIVMSNTAVDAMTTTLSTYWASQSAGQVASISRPAAVQRFVSANACDPDAIWAEAAAKFETDPIWYWGYSAADHLVVIVPDSCDDGGGAGLGTIGSLQNGGLVWAQAFAPILGLTLAHEFGHNVGLEHSNASECTNNTVEGIACADQPYFDFYDIMGGGLYYSDATGFKSNTQLMALNVTQKNRLGALTTADLPSVALAAGATSRRSAFTLKPASATSGLRGLEVTDPRTNEVYFVEYRDGKGIDSGSLYASGFFPHYGLGLGVRVLQLRADGYSAVLTRPNADPATRTQFMRAAESFVSASGGLAVTVTGTGASAAVTVDLVAAQVELTSATVSGTTKVGSLLTAHAGTWGPGAVTLAHQWYRTGVLISGATAATYTLAGADAGKTMSVTVTGSRLGYASASKTSSATAAVAAGTLSTVTPTITGTKKVGYTLTANPGTWGPATVTLKYQWYRSGVLITGATANTYKLAAADLAKTMTVKVTGSKTGYITVAKTSVATTAVVVGTLTAPTPTVTGTKKVGYTLTANPGTWGPATVTLKYQWYRTGVAITGGTAKTYKLVSADRYDTIKVRVTGVKTGYTSVAKYSASTVKVI